MKMTRTLPTDKNGNVYYGPKTYAAAEKAVNEIRASAGNAPRIHSLTQERRLVAQMRTAGYGGVAARVAKDFCISE